MGFRRGSRSGRKAKQEQQKIREAESVIIADIATPEPQPEPTNNHPHDDTFFDVEQWYADKIAAAKARQREQSQRAEEKAKHRATLRDARKRERRDADRDRKRRQAEQRHGYRHPKSDGRYSLSVPPVGVYPVKVTTDKREVGEDDLFWNDNE